MKRLAFTLVELMIIIGILGILAALVLPTFTSAQGKASAATIATNMRSLADACRVAYEQNGQWPTYDFEEGDDDVPDGLDGLMSESAWSDITESWGTEEISLTANGNSLTFAAEGAGNYTEVLAELERIVDDNAEQTGKLQWQANATQYLVSWTLVD